MAASTALLREQSVVSYTPPRWGLRHHDISETIATR
jgi:hypothetical protein